MRITVNAWAHIQTWTQSVHRTGAGSPTARMGPSKLHVRPSQNPQGGPISARKDRLDGWFPIILLPGTVLFPSGEHRLERGVGQHFNR